MFQVRKENMRVGPHLALLAEDGVDPARNKINELPTEVKNNSYRPVLHA